MVAASLELLAGLSLIIVVSTVFAVLAKHFRQPLLVAYILAGILIGPVGFGLLTNRADILALSELGVAFLLFAIGIESDIRKLFQMRYIVVFGGLAQVFITSAAIFGLMQWIGLGFIESVYIGLMLAFSSTAIVVKILSGQNRLATLQGRLMVGFLLVQDAIAIIALPILANPETLTHVSLALQFLAGFGAIIALALILNRLVLPRILAYLSGSSELFFLAVISSCFAFIFLAYLFNFSIAMGAFIGGLTLSSLAYNSEAASKIKGLRDFFATIFFVSLGMQLSFSFAGFPWLALIIMLAAVYLINPLIFFLVSLFAGYGSRIALFIGLGLSQASEFSFILANQALALGQLSPELFNASIMVIVFSMLTTPYLMSGDERVYALFRKFFVRLDPLIAKTGFAKKLKHLENLPDENKLKNHVVIAGAGMFGIELAEELKKSSVVVVLDHNPHKVAHAMNHGIYSLYGEVINSDLWEKINLGKARLLVMAVPDMQQAIQAVRQIKKEHKKLAIFCRAQSFRDALALYAAGADYVIMHKLLGSRECLQASIGFLKGKRSFIKSRKQSINDLMQKIREEEEEERNHKL